MDTVELTCEGCDSRTQFNRIVLEGAGTEHPELVCDHCGGRLSLEGLLDDEPEKATDVDPSPYPPDEGEPNRDVAEESDGDSPQAPAPDPLAPLGEDPDEDEEVTHWFNVGDELTARRSSAPPAPVRQSSPPESMEHLLSSLEDGREESEEFSVPKSAADLLSADEEDDAGSLQWFDFGVEAPTAGSFTFDSDPHRLPTFDDQDDENEATRWFSSGDANETDPPVSTESIVDPLAPLDAEQDDGNEVTSWFDPDRDSLVGEGDESPGESEPPVSTESVVDPLAPLDAEQDDDNEVTSWFDPDHHSATHELSGFPGPPGPSQEIGSLRPHELSNDSYEDRREAQTVVERAPAPPPPPRVFAPVVRRAIPWGISAISTIGFIVSMGTRPSAGETTTDAVPVDRAAAPIQEHASASGTHPGQKESPQGPADATVDEDFDRSAAEEALREAAAGVAACKKPGDPSGQARVAVTFAPEGNVVWSAVREGALAGTKTGGCIARVFRGVRIAPFHRDPVTMSRVVHID